MDKCQKSGDLPGTPILARVVILWGLWLFSLDAWTATCGFAESPHILAPAAQPRSPTGQTEAVDGPITANSQLKDVQSWTDRELGAAQGITRISNKWYVYGDAVQRQPRVGVIREYDEDFRFTGRELVLTRKGKTLLQHPTGLTQDPRQGTWIGNTVNQVATLYQIDWDQAWVDGNLDHAVLCEATDDAAINGCRPEFVTHDGKSYLATADYGLIRPEIRLLNPQALIMAKRTSAPGVVTHRILAGPFNQSLAWNAERGELTCIQNVMPGIGWQLEVINLDAAIKDGRTTGPGVLARRWTLPPHTELEGYFPLNETEGIFVIAQQMNNITRGTIVETDSTVTQPGWKEPTLP
ncbi:MAG: hypothetical protein SFX18_11460 [Pirellulales bacterium]|nr:hypothetical protein [Pirellulales bacterium]